MVTKNLNELTVGDLIKIFDDFKDKGLIFDAGFEQIARRFLSKYVPGISFSTAFDALKAAYEKHMEESDDIVIIVNGKEEVLKSDIPDDEEQFYEYICRKYFFLKREPRVELMNLYRQATEDLRSVDETLKYINDKLEEITKRNKAGEIQEKKPILYHYQRLNEKAKSQIYDFMLYEIEEYALSSSYDMLAFSFDRVPYNYRWNPDGYKPAIPNDLMNKFGDLPFPKFRELVKLYKEDKVAFFSYLDQFIQQQNIVNDIRYLLTKHHLFEKRSDVILEALSTYETGAKIMFANAVPTIIEGIFHDLCLLSGDTEDNLLQQGFQYKLDFLQPVLSWELYYEYYAFRFRIFRNKVAHGRLEKSDVDELADLLLLDLHHVIKMAFSKKLALNKKLSLIDKLSQSIESPDYKYLIKYILQSKYEVPDYYGLNDTINAIEALKHQEDFWTYLEKLIAEGGEPEKHGIISIIHTLTTDESLKERGKAIMKKARIGKPDKKIAANYLKSLSE